MIEIVQAGQAGKSARLFDMHRLRRRIFAEKLGWKVTVTAEGLEVDQFDRPDTVYLLALNGAGHVVGSWRLLPSTGPTMIGTVWPQFLSELPLPYDPVVWEVSRFAVSPLAADPVAAKAESQLAVAELFCGLTALCLKVGIREIFTLYDDRIAAMLRRLDCAPYAVTAPQNVDGAPAQVGAFRTDAAMLARLRAATGYQADPLANCDLPPALLDRDAAYA